MNQRDKDIYNAISLLVLLHGIRKQGLINLSVEEQRTLKITQEHLDKNGLTISQFHNSLVELDKKGYLHGFSIIEDIAYEQLQKLLNDQEYEKILNEVKKVSTNETSESLKEAIARYFEQRLPPNTEFDREGFMQEDISLEEIVKEAREIINDPRLFGGENKPVSIVMLMPFRSIERLYEQMGNGKKFDEVKDGGIWYDNEEQQFHYDEKTLSTKHNKKPYTHYVFKALFSQIQERKIYYAEVEEFDLNRDTQKELKSYYDSLNSFVSKDSRLKEIFSVHTKYLEIHEDYIDQSH